jgi:hypothetical protein
MGLHGGRRAATVILALLVAVGLPVTVVAARAVDHCIVGEQDLNALYGVSEPVVWYPCPNVDVGVRFRANEVWGMGATFGDVPPEFVPGGPTPLADFLAKVVSLTWIVDAGTRLEQRFTFTNVADLYTHADADGSVVSGATLGTLPPLKGGKHVLQAVWTFRAMHCDGMGTCTGPGDQFEFPMDIMVRTGH